MMGMDILTEYAEANGMTVAEFLKGKARAVSRPRHDAMRAIRERTNLSLPQIGRIFGRDHTTIMSGIQESKARAAINALRGEE